MAIRIITDSASDISQEKAKEWDITVLPLTVRFGEEVYLDGVTLPPHVFYEKLVETDEIPKTSQITPYVYKDAFEKAVSEGNQVLCFCLSSGVSGSFQSACMAAEEYPGQVFVIDTQQFCISQYIIVERAVQLREAGMSAEKIAETILQEQKDAHVIAVFDTLEYLKLGGRISSAAAMFGNILRVKPVLTIEDGAVKLIGKGDIRGMGKLYIIGRIFPGLNREHHPFLMAFRIDVYILKGDIKRRIVAAGGKVYRGRLLDPCECLYPVLIGEPGINRDRRSTDQCCQKLQLNGQGQLFKFVYYFFQSCRLLVCL